MSRMSNKNLKWEIKGKLKDKKDTLKVSDIVDTLLQNRKITTKKGKDEFFSPTHPNDLDVKELGINKLQVKKAITRIKKAKTNKEKVIVYGDYDADGITATAILWETLDAIGLSVLPYLPDRFTEGYGLNGDSIEKLKENDPDIKLIITVDNGIVAHDAVARANKLGIDVVISDHHEKEKKLPKAYAIVHTTKLSGSAVSWILSREIKKKIKLVKGLRFGDGLELAGIGTIADMVPMIEANRSFAKFGLEAVNVTKRIGLKSLLNQAQVKTGFIGSYMVGFIIAPRLNAPGRLEKGIDSLRLLCVRDDKKADDLSLKLGKINDKRKKILDDVVKSAEAKLKKEKEGKVIVLSDKNYHEGVVGLAASRLVERFYKPSFVISKGDKFSRGSARSISGFNIIAAIRKLKALLENEGGHKMAAGFTIKTNRIKQFEKEMNKIAKAEIKKEMLAPKLSVDLEIDLKTVKYDLADTLKKFEPTGIGCPRPLFFTRDVCVLDARLIGKDKSHIRMKLEKDGKVINGVGFGLGEFHSKLEKDKKIDIIYSVEINEWNGDVNVELRLKDIKTK
ncbi:single-stranded-DNA-specific exonuclease RecJ [Patescibacteria group bacterium]